MKKIFAISILLMFSISFVTAQISDNKVVKTSTTPAKDTTVVVETDNGTEEIYLEKENQMAVGINGSLNFPLSGFKSLANIGFGFSGVFLYNLSDNFQLTGSLGYLSWGGDKSEEIAGTYNEAKSSFTSIPILGGLRYTFDVRRTKLIPYVGAELGFHIYSTPKIEVLKTDETVISSEKDETNFYFGFGFGGGVIYELNSNVKLDGSLYYNTIGGDETIGYLGLKAGFIISIN